MKTATIHHRIVNFLYCAVSVCAAQKSAQARPQYSQNSLVNFRQEIQLLSAYEGWVGSEDYTETTKYHSLVDREKMCCSLVYTPPLGYCRYCAPCCGNDGAT